VTLADGLEVDRNGQVSNMRLFETTSGNMTEYTVAPGGTWHGVLIERFVGYVKQSDVSKADAKIALASSGSWSGGGNWRGWVFGKPGAVVWFGCKGHEVASFRRKWRYLGNNKTRKGAGRVVDFVVGRRRREVRQFFVKKTG